MFAVGQPPTNALKGGEDWLLSDSKMDQMLLKAPHVPIHGLGSSNCIATPPSNTPEFVQQQQLATGGSDATGTGMGKGGHHHRRCESSNQLLPGDLEQARISNSNSNQSSNDDEESARQDENIKDGNIHMAAAGSADGGGGGSADGGAGGSGGSGNDAATQQKDGGDGSGSDGNEQGGSGGGRRGSTSHGSDGSGSPLSDPPAAAVHRHKKAPASANLDLSSAGSDQRDGSRSDDNEHAGSGGSGNEGAGSGNNNNAQSNNPQQHGRVNANASPPHHHHHHHHRLDQQHTGSSGHAPSPIGGAANLAAALLHSLPSAPGGQGHHSNFGPNKRQHHEVHHARQYQAPQAIAPSLSAGTPIPTGSLSSLGGFPMPTAAEVAAALASEPPMSALNGANTGLNGILPFPFPGDLLGMPAQQMEAARSGTRAMGSAYPPWGGFGVDGGVEGTGQAPGDIMMFDTAAVAAMQPFSFDAADFNAAGGNRSGAGDCLGDENESDDDENGSSQVRGRALVGGESVTRATKRLRLVWTPELHHRFMLAVHQLGVNHAVPKGLLQLMNVEGMTRENVASHLQKYRMYLKRLAGVSGNDPIPAHILVQVQEQALRSHAAKNMLQAQQQQSATLQAQQQIATQQQQQMAAQQQQHQMAMYQAQQQMQAQQMQAQQQMHAAMGGGGIDPQQQMQAQQMQAAMGGGGIDPLQQQFAAQGNPGGPLPIQSGPGSIPAKPELACGMVPDPTAASANCAQQQACGAFGNVVGATTQGGAAEGAGGASNQQAALFMQQAMMMQQMQQMVQYNAYLVAAQQQQQQQMLQAAMQQQQQQQASLPGQQVQPCSSYAQLGSGMVPVQPEMQSPQGDASAVGAGMMVPQQPFQATQQMPQQQQQQQQQMMMQQMHQMMLMQMQQQQQQQQAYQQASAASAAAAANGGSSDDAGEQQMQAFMQHQMAQMQQQQQYAQQQQNFSL